jgi:uncharacterized Fe-S radical SAM superfamily protein PflX
MRVTFYDFGYGMLGVQHNMACLHEAGHEVSLFFDNSMSMDHLAQDMGLNALLSLKPKQVLEGLMASDPQVVCFSIPTYVYKSTKALISLLKREYPEVLVAVGGVHPTLLPHVTARNPEIDFTCVGEGEIAFPKLVTDIESRGAEAVKGSPREAHPGIWNLWNGEMVNRGFSPTVKDLDVLPYPEKRHHYAANPALQPIYTLLASRGCVFTCTFCNSASLNTKYRKEGNAKFYRCRSVDSIIEELQWAKRTYQPKFVQFFDDIFGVKPSWLEEFSVKYKREIGLPFEIQTNPKIHNEHSMQLLADCGCVHLEFGFQSANAEIRREMLSRKETNEQVKELIRAARGKGMLMELDLIVNLPGETEAEVQEAIDFVEAVNPELVNVSFLQYFPKTPIIQTAIKHGILQEEHLLQIEEGEMVNSMRLLKRSGLNARYRILPFQMYFAAHYPRWLARLIMGFTGLPGLRRFFSRFGSFFLYLTRIWVGITDKRDFYHRRQIPRATVAAIDILRLKLGIPRKRVIRPYNEGDPPLPQMLIEAPLSEDVPAHGEKIAVSG